MKTLRLLAPVLAVALSLTMPSTARSQTVLYVAAYYGPGVGEYDAQTGGTINSVLVPAASYPRNIVVAGDRLYVTDFVNSSTGQGSVGLYERATGTPINATLVPNLYRPAGLALSGNVLYVSFAYSAKIGTYDATTGAAINASLISGLTLGRPHFIALAENRLYVSGGSGIIGVFDATTGAAINASFVTGLAGPRGVVVSGGSLYVANQTGGTIGKYDALTGATIDAAFVAGLSSPSGLALEGDRLFVADAGTGIVGAYDAITGAAIDAALISGLASPWGLAVSSIPEPSSTALWMVSGALVLVLGQRLTRRMRLANVVDS